MSSQGNQMLHDIQRKKRRRLIMVNVLAFLGAFAIFTLLGFVNKEQKAIRCWKTEVRIRQEGEQPFFAEKEILKMVYSVSDSLVGMTIQSIPIEKIHTRLMEHTGIREAHVYTTVDGKVVIQIDERKPIARIFNNKGESFYLDEQGFTMPTSSQYTPKVPVFVGAIESSVQRGSIFDSDDHASTTRLRDIHAFVTGLRENDFMQAQLEHVHINEQGEFELIPRVGNHTINMGKPDNLQVKIKKLMAFYANTIQTKDLNKYSVIDLRYRDQVVCVKR